jgi:hypothetical protein
VDKISEEAAAAVPELAAYLRGEVRYYRSKTARAGLEIAAAALEKAAGMVVGPVADALSELRTVMDDLERSEEAHDSANRALLAAKLDLANRRTPGRATAVKTAEERKRLAYIDLTTVWEKRAASIVNLYDLDLRVGEIATLAGLASSHVSRTLRLAREANGGGPRASGNNAR